MELNNNNNPQPNAYRVEDDDNLEEKDLRRETFMFGSEEKEANKPGMEGQGYGGQSFGEDNNTPSGDDGNNPSRNAGYGNEYFKRSEPAEEHPEFNNFKDPNQLGQPNFTQSSGAALTGQSDEENAGPKQEDAGNGNNNSDDQNLSYQEGTADNDGYETGVNEEGDVAGNREVPDQQKVGE
ncbi:MULTISPECIES: hypothetical protein [unclassified Mucilaginibacter]|uniref:hypothetical protein n=1 Tax=unclassified Mucilaginibacter TaxID=2617802 RepID=UPI00096423EB|nr:MULTISPECIES: hypothetical protein [unclassified Mucilaginibacter]HEK19268.1 hypothetical protein [Bacteroidota bacterium]OJW18455.1 MAG: hypothetical protein BGO48_18140 [Mucilaginibacter sp. 44-25]PLW89893.1 MAG: hypothetical protein C0154_09170 [Mucilaginibacter sp.]PMP65597.1 MAG: hypothetical protein C0191_03110 [Mucilaginibacter sp.]PMP65889.1 MAG: hypothetical protein C0191_02345 [Mucilaginibacter sp.]